MSFTRIDHYEKEYADTHHDTALNVTQGVEEQPIVSPYFKRRKKRALSTGEYVEGILAGNITTLSQAITLVESSNPDHYISGNFYCHRLVRTPSGKHFNFESYFCVYDFKKCAFHISCF